MPIVQQLGWQYRFDKLLGTTYGEGLAGDTGDEHNSHPLPAVSSSKAPLTQAASLNATVVTLPSKIAGRAGVPVHITAVAADRSADANTKIQADEELFEGPTFGSTPTVRLPSTPHVNHHMGYTHDTRLKMETLPAPLPVDAQIVADVDLLAPEADFNGAINIIINFNGDQLNIKCVKYSPSSTQALNSNFKKNGNVNGNGGRRSSSWNTKPVNGDAATNARNNNNNKKPSTQWPKAPRRNNGNTDDPASRK